MEVSRMWKYCAMLLVLFQNAFGGGFIEVKFESYSDSCKEDVNQNPCDPMFSFCVTKPSATLSLSRRKCLYGYTGESGHFDNKNKINLAQLTNIKGIENPWNMYFDNLLDDQIKLIARVQDDDTVNDDHMETWSITIKNKVWQARADSKWERYSMKKNDYTLKFSLRIYCTDDYYGSKCIVKCVPPSENDHYTCNKGTGQKDCDKGWKGSDCFTYIDDCNEKNCFNGTCIINDAGNYTCKCKEFYEGVKCEVDSLCKSLPCQNGGMCHFNGTLDQYSCNCTEDWIGSNCEQRKDPCENDPCFHDGNCTSNSQNTSYVCACSYLYMGLQCESTATTTTTTITTMSTTSASEETSSSSLHYNSTMSSSSNMTSSVNNNMSRDSVIISTRFDDTTIKKESTTVYDPDPRNRVKQSQAASSSFPPWAVVIAVMTFIASILFILYRIHQRRKKKREAGEKLAFDNNTYGDMNRKRPNTETVIVEEKEKVQKGNGTDGMDEDGYVIPSTVREPSHNAQARSPAIERVENNLYTDSEGISEGGSAIYDNIDDHDDDKDEQHYQDLDELAMNLHKQKSDQEEPYSDFPRNIPTEPQTSFKPKPRMCEEDNLPPPPPTPKGDVSLPEPPIEVRPYAVVPINRLKSCDPFASKVDDDDNVSEFGLPKPIHTPERGYEMPTGLFPGKRTPETSGYEVPSNTSSVEFPTFNNHGYDSPRSSLPSQTATKPPVPARPTDLNKSQKEEEDLNVLGKSSKRT